MKNIIEFGEGITYLNEVTEYKLNGILVKDKFSLPNGIFNKVLTGCGGTTIALEDNRKTIICSPRITLLKNKHGQYPNTMLVIGGINKSEIVNYINNIDIHKILVTYDSLYKVLDIITDIDNWHIVVDEFQCVLTDSSLKSVTEMNFLHGLTGIKNITFMSATPLLNKYISQMDILKDMPYYECKFTDTYKVNVFRRKVNKPINKGIEIIEMYQKGNFPALETGETSREAVIYLNSVNNIISLVKTTKLQSNDVNIICAENEDNRTKIKKSLGNGFDIGRIPLKDEKPKLITLCTSTAYFGVDMYSDNALTFVISDCNKINTTVDISTELVQIAGRLRNADNPFRYYIYFIYNTNREELDDIEFNNMIDTKTTVTL